MALLLRYCRRRATWASCHQDWRTYQTTWTTNLYCVCLLPIQKDRTSDKVAVLLYNTFKKEQRKSDYWHFCDTMTVTSTYAAELCAETKEWLLTLLWHHDSHLHTRSWTECRN
jgi:hypothetical protein